MQLCLQQLREQTVQSSSLWSACLTAALLSELLLEVLFFTDACQGGAAFEQERQWFLAC